MDNLRYLMNEGWQTHNVAAQAREARPACVAGGVRGLVRHLQPTIRQCMA
jgi:hypothetical protein